MTPLDYLYGLELHGIKLGLENIRRLLLGAENPQDAYPIVHVGGTNGKGSVVAMLDAVLRAAGYRVGRFTSPHLIGIRERFLVNGEPISEGDLDAGIEGFREIAGRQQLQPTFFEVCTAVAFQHLAEADVDVALIEVGMGGRFDSTNTVTPRVSIITNIALEHTRYLGDTLEKIAFEKAGIVKPHVPVVVGETHAGPRDVILERARKQEAPVRLLGRDFRYTLQGAGGGARFSYERNEDVLAGIALGLPGSYQAHNASLAVAAAEILSEEFDRIDEGALRSGLHDARWPCRLERVLASPEVIIDVAHNAAGAEQLAASIPDRCVVVLAIANDKDADAIIRALGTCAEHLLLTQFDGARSLSAKELSRRAGTRAHETMDSIPEAVVRGIALAESSGLPLVIAGSLFTAGQARALLIDEYGAPPLQF